MSKNKTVRKGFLSKILFLLALFIAVCVPASFAAVASCSGVTDSQTRYGTISGTCYAYYCSSGTLNKLGSVDSSKCASCSGVKYAPSGTCGTCEYKCCSDGNWSGCNQECPDPSEACSSSQCWNGSKCVDEPSTSSKQYNGKCYYYCTSYTCNKGRGWICGSKKYFLQDGQWKTNASYMLDRYGNISSSGISKCSTKVDTNASAYSSCITQGASVRGIPYDAMELNFNVHEGNCFVISSCRCPDGSSTFTDPSQALSVCGYNMSSTFWCSGKELSCYKKSESSCE